MKKLMKSLMLFAAAAMALTSCENEAMNEGIEANETYTLSFTAGIPKSRTSVEIGDTANFSWSEGDKASFVQYAVGADKVNKKNSNAAVINGDEATFTTQFSAVEGATAFHYAAYFPASDLVNNNDKTFDNVIIKLPADQNYIAGSFDPAADLMMSKTIMNVTEQDGHGGYLEFARLVAIGKMTLTGVEAGEVISSVKFTINDAVLAGNVTLDFVNTTAEFATEGSNSITISGANVGNEIVFTCFPGAYTGAYTIEVETDQANYKKEGNFAKAFNLTAGNVLTFTASAGTRTEKVFEVGETIDVLDRAFTGVTSTSYSTWSGKTSNSNAVYAGQSAGGNSSIQLRSDNNNSGIITTASGGYAKKVVVTWNSNTTSGRTLDIYGKNTAYTAATDLYDTSKQGTKLGSIVYGTSTELTISGDYQYIGMRSNNKAMYLTEIEITWSSEAGGNTPSPEPEISLTTGEGEGTEASPYDVTRALEAIEKGHESISSAYVKGTISQIDEISTQYGNATYFISVDGSTTNQLEVYRGLGLNGAKFTSEDALHLGDVVVIKGELTDYNGTKEFTTGSQIVSLVCGHQTVEPIVIEVENVNIEAAESYDTIPVNVTINNDAEWTYEAKTTADWIAVNWNNGVYYIAGENTGAERTATVEICATDGENEKTVSFTITQAAGSIGGDVAYVKVTEAPADWSGTYLIVYEDGTNAYVFNGQDAVNGYVSATISDSKIAVTDALNSVSVEIAKSGDGYSIKTANGYIYGTSGSNTLKFNATTPQANTISWETNNVKIESNTSVLRFNNASNQMRFRYYKSSSYSGQKETQLYKLTN